MKRLISILLAVMIIASCAAISVSAYSSGDLDVQTVQEAVEEYELLYGVEAETYRYYFLMPNGTNGDKGDDPNLESYGKFAPSWYNEMANTAGIYWWETGILDPPAWIGYIAMKSDVEDVYYADVPTFVTGCNWNNGVDGGLDSTQPQYYLAAQSVNVGLEYYDVGESKNYPNGTENFNNMIYVIDPDLVTISEFSQMQMCGGEWYYYYGDGHYGFTEGGSEADCLRGDHNHSAVIGDADGDGDVSIMDATEIQMVLAQIKAWSYDGAEAASDVDGDGDVSIMDATEIQMILAGLR